MSYLNLPHQILYLSEFHDHVLVDFTIEYQAANQYQTEYGHHVKWAINFSYASITVYNADVFWIIAHVQFLSEDCIIGYIGT